MTGKISGIAPVLIIGAVVHIMMLLSVFDIYFQSSVIHGIEEHSSPISTADAKRLVIFVADGLRMDKCFGSKLDNGDWAAPYIRHLAVSEGVWGRSQTRVPTESRPGHVALLAGFYEDVSAVTRGKMIRHTTPLMNSLFMSLGWKENPVEFDSVFNRSRITWAWGSPDILHMFAKGTASSKMFTNTYNIEEEDFADTDPSRLDAWVFERFEEFINHSSINLTISSQLRQDKVILFLHLLGMDTMGHSRKPGSKEYVEGIRIVDNGIRRVVNLLENYFESDGKTTYMFTADHGMTDWGSHGSSDVEETSTPMVVWGAGIRQPIKVNNQMFLQAAEWDLANILAEDIQQADLTPLMASIIGIGIPVNSVGVVPIEFLAGSESHKAVILFSNAKQLGAQFLRHWELKEQESFALLFRSYSDLDKGELLSKYATISRLIEDGDLKTAIEETRLLIDVLLRGIRYFQTYHRMFLSVVVLTGFGGWILYLICWLFHLNPNQHIVSHDLPIHFNKLSVAVSAVIFVLCYVQSYPVTYYFYIFTTYILWNIIYKSKTRQISNIISNLRFSYGDIFCTVLLLLSLELMVLVFFQRWILSFPWIILSLWPFTTHLFNKQKGLCCIWMIVCFITATFPILPIIGRDTNYGLVVACGLLVTIITTVYILRSINRQFFEQKFQNTFYVTLIQVCLVLTSTVNVWIVSFYMKSELKVPVMCHFLSWLIFPIAIMIPSLTTTELFYRLFSVGLSLVTIFILFSFTHEAILFVGFLILLTLWMIIEYKLEIQNIHKVSKYLPSSRQSSLTFDDLRRAYLSLLMLMTSYFGLGNTASVNSFTVTSVFCFVTVFNPFLMGFLLLWKILIPLLAVASAVRSVQKCLHRPSSLLFGSILLLSDVLVVNFFFLIKDEGSWLEIGSSIGRFVVAAVTSIAFIILYSISAILTDLSWSLTCRESNRLHAL
ncbi:hypothetical protein CHUAL_013534 [Chamberlinius hualienensis]